MSAMPATPSPAGPRPFLKWAGGKRQILPAILRRVPPHVGTFYEPFVGGGALFLALAGASPRPFRRAVLADRNRELVAAWRMVRDDVEHLIEALRDLAARPVTAEVYYDVRDQDPAALDAPAAAARLLYLNRTCFNGLYRLNRSGRFNVPFGGYRNPKILDAGNLRAVSRALAGVAVEAKDFEDVIAEAGPGDFVYFDPPYSPVSETASFTAYDALPFGPAEQERLAARFRSLRRRGVYALLSNSRVAATERLYEGLAWDVLPVRRSINSRGDRRGPVEELLVRTHRRGYGRSGKIR
jgi:DNA adenine methylase